MSPTHTPRSNRRNLVSSECCVCSELLTVSAGQPVIRFTCGHCAHEDCCHEWLKQSSDPHQTCPECDAPLEIESGGGSRTRIGRFDRLAARPLSDHISVGRSAYPESQTPTCGARTPSSALTARQILSTTSATRTHCSGLRWLEVAAERHT